jgi:cytochrome P450
MALLKILLTLLTIFLGIKIARWHKKRRRLVDAIEKIPGPPSVPFAPVINHALVMIYLDSLQHRLGSFVIIYHLISTLYTLFPDTGICRFWLGWKPIVVLFSPENVEQILNSTQIINKADEYKFFEPWIGEGLVTSKRNKWRFRRKILTPAFHFRILNDFLPIMNAEATKLVKKLNQSKYIKPEHSHASSHGAHKTTIDIAPLIALCTLDTICETAMGVNINCQANDQIGYVKSLYEVGEMALTRVTRPWLWFDWIFYRTETGKRFTQARDVMHEFSRKVILERKKEWERALKDSNSNRDASNKMTFDDVLNSGLFSSGNKRLAFLDLMLHQHLIENNMTIDDVQEEVDTFMFAVS